MRRPRAPRISGAKARVWVKIPSLSNTGDTVINLLYGNLSCATNQQNAAQVWTNGFVGVWHLGESLTPAADSTSNTTSLAANAGATSGVAGAIGNAVSFDGSTGFLTTSNAAGLELVGSPGTIAAWINPKAFWTGRICEIGTPGTATGYQFALSGGTSSTRFLMNGTAAATSTSPLSSNT